MMQLTRRLLLALVLAISALATGMTIEGPKAQCIPEGQACDDSKGIPCCNDGPRPCWCTWVKHTGGHICWPQSDDAKVEA